MNAVSFFFLRGCVPDSNSAMSASAPKRENLVLNLIFNIALPTLVLSFLSGPKSLGTMGGLIAALAFPLSYGIYDFAQRRQTNFFSIIGFLSVLATGGLGLTQAGPMSFAIKEAALPLIIGGAVLISQKTKRPLIKTMLLNDQILDMPRVDAALLARGSVAELESLLRWASHALAGAFFVGSAINFVFVRIILKSPPGTEAFNVELGRMTALNWPITSLPVMIALTMIMWKVIRGIERLTGLTLDEILRSKETGKA